MLFVPLKLDALVVPFVVISKLTVPCALATLVVKSYVAPVNISPLLAVIGWSALLIVILYVALFSFPELLSDAFMTNVYVSAVAPFAIVIVPFSATVIKLVVVPALFFSDVFVYVYDSVPFVAAVTLAVCVEFGLYVFAVNVTLLNTSSFAVHKAYNVRFLFSCASVNVALSSYAFAPPSVVAHPAKVYPVLLNPFAVNVLLEAVIVCVSIEPPVLVVPLNVIVLFIVLLALVAAFGFPATSVTLFAATLTECAPAVSPVTVIVYTLFAVVAVNVPFVPFVTAISSAVKVLFANVSFQVNVYVILSAVVVAALGSDDIVNVGAVVSYFITNASEGSDSFPAASTALKYIVSFLPLLTPQASLPEYVVPL